MILAQRLTKFRVRKVSIVPYGANDETVSFKKSADTDEVLIFKSADLDLNKADKNLGVNEMVKDPLKKEGEPPEMTEEEKKKKREEEEAAAKAKAGEAAKSAPVKKEEMTEEEKKKKEEEEKAKGEGPKEEAAKSAPIMAELRKMVADAIAPIQAENVALKKQLDGEQAIRETREYIAKAASEYPHLGMPAEIGTLLLSLQKSDLPSADKDRISTLLNQANTGMAYLTKSHGYGGAPLPEKSAAAEINEKAKGLIEKSSDKKMDLAIARTEVRKMHPDLAARERQEEKTGVT